MIVIVGVEEEQDAETMYLKGLHPKWNECEWDESREDTLSV
jgi:hypothetical protein